MTTEEQKKKYEDTWNKMKRMGWPHEYAEHGIINGTDAEKLYCSAHSEGKKEGWNVAIATIQESIQRRHDAFNEPNLEPILEELKRLKR